MLKQFVVSRQLISTLFLITLHFAVVDRANGQEAKQEWGNLSATFLYDGEPPEPRKLKIDKDIEFYRDPILDQSLVVDAKSKGIANVTIWLQVANDEMALPIHSSYADVAHEDVVLDTIKGQIEPHVCLVWTPQTLLIKNSEPIGHNHKLDSFMNPSFGDLIPTGGTVTRKFTKEERGPSAVSCNIHPWESGYLLIRNNPYMAVSNAAGKLQIKNLPVGKHRFFVWHERAGLVRDAQMGDEREILKGRLEMEIKPGENDLGKVLIPAKHFEAKK